MSLNDEIVSRDKEMASLRKLPFKLGIRFARPAIRSFFTDYVPVDDHISGLNDTQQQVST